MRILILIVCLVAMWGCVSAPPQVRNRKFRPVEGDSAEAKARGDAQPVGVYVVYPIYPEEMAGTKVRGEVLVDLIVERDGSVQIAEAIHQTNAKFAQAAVDCVKKWKFRPGLKAGVPVRSHAQVPIVFDPQ